MQSSETCFCTARSVTRIYPGYCVWLQFIHSSLLYIILQCEFHHSLFSHSSSIGHLGCFQISVSLCLLLCSEPPCMRLRGHRCKGFCTFIPGNGIAGAKGIWIAQFYKTVSNCFPGESCRCVLLAMSEVTSSSTRGIVRLLGFYRLNGYNWYHLVVFPQVFHSSSHLHGSATNLRWGGGGSEFVFLIPNKNC